MKHIIYYSIVLLLLFGCTNQSGISNHNSSSQSYREYRAIIQDYLAVNVDTMTARIRGGNQLTSLSMNPDSIELSAQKLALESKELLSAANTLLDKEDLKGFHDLIYENRNYFLSSPANTLDNESRYIDMVLTLVENVYPINKEKQNKELIELLDFRLLHIKMTEFMQDYPMIHPEHMPIALTLINSYREVNNLDKGIEVGEDALSILAQYDNSNEYAVDLVEGLIDLYELTGNQERADFYKSFTAGE